MVLPVGDDNPPGRGFAWVTVGLILVNVFVFVVLQLGHDAFTYGYSTIPREITTGTDIVSPVTTTIDGEKVTIPEAPGPKPIYLTLLWSMFMHGGWLHLGGNMLFLFIFGDNVEWAFGRVFYLLFYLGAGLIASLTQIAVDPTSVIPNLGASGAIAGALGAYIVLFPQNRVRVWAYFAVVSVPAVVVLGLWILTQFLNGFGSIAPGTGGVAYFAHIGGFTTGVVVALLMRAVGLVRAPRSFAY
jgi:membrane associated rhomboid family serine protease